MRPWTKFVTYTVRVDCKEWLHGSSEPTKNLLLSFLVDIASGLDLHGTQTACALDNDTALWFTFSRDEDRQQFETALEEIWQDHWLA